MSAGDAYCLNIWCYLKIGVSAWSCCICSDCCVPALLLVCKEYCKGVHCASYEATPEYHAVYHTVFLWDSGWPSSKSLFKGYRLHRCDSARPHRWFCVLYNARCGHSAGDCYLNPYVHIASHPCFHLLWLHPGKTLNNRMITMHRVKGVLNIHWNQFRESPVRFTCSYNLCNPT